MAAGAILDFEKIAITFLGVFERLWTERRRM